MNLSLTASHICYDVYNEHLKLKWIFHKKKRLHNKKKFECNDCWICNSSEPIYVKSSISDAELYIFVLENKYLTIAFVGTDSFKDVYLDMESHCTKINEFGNNGNNDCCPCIHSGFLKQYQSVIIQINVVISKILSNNKHIKHVLVTGHSLGGALASIFATLQNDILKSKYGIEEIITITFGSPRVGNKSFAQIAENKIDVIQRFVYKHDPVPTMLNAPRFWHIGNETRLGENKIWKHFSGFILFDIFFVKDHEIENYKDELLLLSQI